MHAQRIIQDLLQTECGAIHAKRRVTLALMVQASCIGHLSLIGISRRLDTATALRHRIKRCDRLLGNLHLSNEKLDVYRAMVQRILIDNPRPAVVIDWSDLSADRSQHLLRAAPEDRGEFEYVRSAPVACRLVLYKKPACHRQAKTAFGKRARCRHSLKQAKTQTEPWLLAASPGLAELDARAVVDLYSGRMQIEQSFRDVKNPRWGLGLSLSQTTRPDRLAILLLIGALAMFALWLIGLAAQARGYRVNFGSSARMGSTLLIISLARWWLEEAAHRATRFRKQEEMNAMEAFRNMAWGRQI